MEINEVLNTDHTNPGSGANERHDVTHYSALVEEGMNEALIYCDYHRQYGMCSGTILAKNC